MTSHSPVPLYTPQINDNILSTVVMPSFVYVNEATIDEELKCPICIDVFSLNAVSCNNCMNTFCSPCVELQTRCPICREDPKPLLRIALPLRNIIAKLKVTCTQCRKCDIPRGDFDHHVHYSCPIDCPFGCNARITRAMLHDHGSICTQRRIPCKSVELGCEFETIRSQMSDHEAECPYSKISHVLIRLKREILSSQKRIRELEQELEIRDYRPSKRSNNIIQPRPIHVHAYVTSNIPPVQYLQPNIPQNNNYPILAPVFPRIQHPLENEADNIFELSSPLIQRHWDFPHISL